MFSAHVTEQESNEVIKEGVSGEMARKMQRQGDGIGMWRINQMLEINEGSFETQFGPIKETKMGLHFSDNIFILKFAKY